MLGIILGSYTFTNLLVSYRYIFISLYFGNADLLPPIGV